MSNMSDQSKFVISKVYGPNYQQANREQKKIFNMIKTGEEEKLLPRCKTVNHPEHLVLLWNIFKWFERVFLPDFTVNYKNCGTCVALPYSHLAPWLWKEHGLLRYSNYLRLPSTSSWTGQVWGASSLGWNLAITSRWSTCLCLSMS